MRQHIARIIQVCALPRGYGLTDVPGLPSDDCSGDQVETGHAIVLPVGGTVADFGLPPDALSGLQA